MLVFGRKVGEEVIIGNDIVVKVVSVRGGKISLGFSAPSDIAINRREIYERMRLERPLATVDVSEMVGEPQVA
jgi:carbon storage regulator